MRRRRSRGSVRTSPALGRPELLLGRVFLAAALFERLQRLLPLYLLWLRGAFHRGSPTPSVRASPSRGVGRRHVLRGALPRPVVHVGQVVTPGADVLVVVDEAVADLLLDVRTP